jgi:hypothetical protein
VPECWIPENSGPFRHLHDPASIDWGYPNCKELWPLLFAKENLWQLSQSFGYADSMGGLIRRNEERLPAPDRTLSVACGRQPLFGRPDGGFDL